MQVAGVQVVGVQVPAAGGVWKEWPADAVEPAAPPSGSARLATASDPDE